MSEIAAITTAFLMGYFLIIIANLVVAWMAFRMISQDKDLPFTSEPYKEIPTLRNTDKLPFPGENKFKRGGMWI